ncbi:MAG: hypothetical protein WAL63_02085 [Solirubrobacteraceae bacterium]
MGEVIYLPEHAPRRLPGTGPHWPAFFFDLGSPMSYLAAERVERMLGEVDWVPVGSTALRRQRRPVGGAAPRGKLRPVARHEPWGQLGSVDRDGSSTRPALVDRPTLPADDLRKRVEAYARTLRLPLVWPNPFPFVARGAHRACTFAREIGRGPAFALAASRLAFCGGFDLDDPEILAEAAAAARVPLQACLVAAGEAWRDDELDLVMGVLRAHRIRELPAIHIGGRWREGASALTWVSARGAQPGGAATPPPAPAS